MIHFWTGKITNGPTNFHKPLINIIENMKILLRSVKHILTFVY